MKCPTCGKEIPNAGKFCGGCGSSLPRICTVCGHSNATESKFCVECGTILHAGRTQVEPSLQPNEARPVSNSSVADRRQLTVMFCDLVGSTARSTQMDPEDLRDVISAFHACIAEVVAPYDGFVAQYLGDGVLIYFGYPHAHDNDAERSIRVALAVIHRVGTLATHGVKLDVRVGIATGPVIAGEIIGTAEKPEKSAIGQTPNLAARLQALAEPNTIVVAHNTRALTGLLFECRDLGHHELKGFAGEIRAWQVLGLSNVEKRFDATRVGTGPLAGRRLELGQLSAILSSCNESGRGRAVHIRGEAGIGKSRLLEEVLSIARQTGFSCHVGQVLDFGSGAGRDAIRCVARDILRLTPNSPDEDVVAAVKAARSCGLLVAEDAVFLNDILDVSQPPELRTVFDAMDASTRSSGNRRTMANLASRASGIQPRVLAVEDVHWADRATLSHLAELAATVSGCPAVLVMTSRPDQDLLDLAWRAEAGAVPLITIDLGPLGEDEATELATSLLGADRDLIDRCVIRATGNPLFLEQLVRNAAESTDMGVPASVQSLVQARLDRLDRADQEALQAASVLGQRFDRGALEHLLASPAYDPERLLERLMVYSQGEEFVFSHALIRDAIYNGLLKSRRRELHIRAAQWYATRDSTVRAEHLERAHDPAAARAYLEAAKSQTAKHRYDIARQLVERGLILATDRSDRFALCCLEGEILHDLGDMQAALKAFESALGAAGSDTDQCRAWIGCAQVKRVTDDIDGAFADLIRAENAATKHELKVEEARIRLLRGNLYFPRGDIAGCLREHGRSLELAREAGSPEHEAAALGGLGDAEYARGRMISAHARLSECVELSRRHGFSRTEVANNAQIAHTMLYQCPQREALSHAAEADVAAARIGHLRAQLNARAVGLHAFPVLEEWDACDAEVERVAVLVRRLGAWRFEQLSQLASGEIAHGRGRRSEAVECLLRAADTARRTSIGFFGPMIQSALARALAETDDQRAALAEGAAQIARGCVGHNQLRFYPDAIDVTLKMHDWDEAERYALQLEIFARAEPMPWTEFFIARGRALAALGRGNGDAGTRQRLLQLLAEGERLEYTAALPALRDALDLA